MRASTPFHIIIKHRRIKLTHRPVERSVFHALLEFSVLDQCFLSVGFASTLSFSCWPGWENAVVVEIGR